MPDNHAPAAQDEQEVTEELKEYQINALNLLDIPFQFFRVVAAKVQAEGITLDIPEQGDQLIDAYLHGALDDPLVAAAGECSNRAAAAATEVHRLQLEELTGSAGEDGNLPSLRKMVERERLENLAMLAYRAVALKFIVTQRIDKILDAEDEPQANALYFELCQDLTPDLVADHSLTTELAEELTKETYWEIDSGDLLDAATEEGPLWAQAVADAQRRREDPGAVTISLGSLISAFDGLNRDLEAQREEQEADQRIRSILATAQFPEEAVYIKDQITNTLMLRSTPTDRRMKTRQAPRPEVNISLGELPQGVSISREFTEWDDDVFRAINTLWYDGTQTFTADMIYRAMTGNPTAKASEETQRKIFESWVRFTSTWMELNTAGVGKAYGFMEVKRTSHVIEGGTDLITMTNPHGTTSVRYYTVSKEPDLIWYANQLKQVARFPIQYLNVPINKNEDVIHVRNLLLDRIYSIPRQSNTILYDYLFSYLDKEQPPLSKSLRDRKTKALRGHIRTMLNYWAQPGGPISSWEEVKKGRSFVGVKVHPRKKAIEASAAGE